MYEIYDAKLNYYLDTNNIYKIKKYRKKITQKSECNMDEYNNKEKIIYGGSKNDLYGSKKIIDEKDNNIYLNNDKFTDNKCYIDENDEIFFGSGGSNAIVVITKDKRVYKFFTIYYSKNETKKNINRNIKNELKKSKNEINIYKLLTKNIINKNISKHYVKMINSNICMNGRELFKDCPSYLDFLENSSKNKICEEKMYNFPIRDINDKYNVIEIEHCDYSCSSFLHDISKLSTIEMKKYLDVFLFQIIYTILSTKKIYPYFSHNDLFIRNILGKKENDNGNYYTYIFNKKKYFIPQKLFFPKINDFGLTNLNKKYHDVNLFNSSTKDIYNLIYDIYDGSNLGGKSLMSLCEQDEYKNKFIKSYFSNFFNVDIIDHYKSNSNVHMNWDWNNILDEEFSKKIEIKEPLYLMENYFYDIFCKNNENIEIFSNEIL